MLQLQCVAVCYSVLQCVEVCCSVLQCVAVYRRVLPCVAVCCRICSVLQCVAACWIACMFDGVGQQMLEVRVCRCSCVGRCICVGVRVCGGCVSVSCVVCRVRKRANVRHVCSLCRLNMCVCVTVWCSVVQCGAV